MINFITIYLSIRLVISEVVLPEDIPASFKFGVATAAYQIEGGWNADGKGPSIWDTFTHNHPEMIADGTNGDVADDSYHLFDKDLELIKDLGLNFYRFSISWPRVLPTGDISSLNQKGINYYNKVINKLLENNIEPMVTMLHYDLPEELQKLGGYVNPLFLRYFEEYTDILFKNFGDRVKVWVTFNEPADYCVPGYGEGTMPPLINASAQGAEYLCMDNTLKGHALAYHLYRKKYAKNFKGKIGITISSRYFYSKEDNADVVNRALQFQLGWLAHPLFSKAGGYPEVMINEVAANSMREGRKWSRLPDMSDEWKEIIKGAADFLGLNYYTSRYVKLGQRNTNKKPSYENDARLEYSVDPKWKRANIGWLYSVPEGLGDLLRWIKEEYDNIEVYITENGWSDDGELNDVDRITSLKAHIREVVKAATQDNCNISGYAVWSLIDNFEWREGYSRRFGLCYVNITSPTRERIRKDSFQIYKDIIRNRKFSDLE